MSVRLTVSVVGACATLWSLAACAPYYGERYNASAAATPVMGYAATPMVTYSPVVQTVAAAPVPVVQPVMAAPMMSTYTMTTPVVATAPMMTTMPAVQVVGVR